jgi:ABC-2 type transport system permease protein
MRYWRRDPRYLGQVPAVVLALALFTVIGVTLPLLPSDNNTAFTNILGTGMIGFGLGLTALMTGYILVADVASDASAWWTHLICGIRGWQDRLGRTIALSLWAIPLLLVGGIAIPLFLGNSNTIPAVLGAMLSLYLTGAAASSVFSALIIYPVPLPGDSPLRMKTGMMGAQMLAQFGCLFAGGLLALPIALWAIFAAGWQVWLVLVVGIVWGAAVLTAGIIVGGRIMDSRGPAILQTLVKNDSRER